MDRVTEVNKVRELAANIAENLGEGTAEELVEFALSDDAAGWNIDTELIRQNRDLLTNLVAIALA